MKSDPVGREGASIASRNAISEATAASIFSSLFFLSGIIRPALFSLVIIAKKQNRKMSSFSSNVTRFSRIADAISCNGS
jgi:hypothetical protein